MKTDIPETFLKNLKGKRVLLYLSSTPFKQEYLTIPYDYVILNSNELEETGNLDEPIRIVDDKVILMSFDNNKAVRVLKTHGVKIQCFVGICDGCCEGGNYECINTNSFFGRLSPILDEKIYYITDHFGRYSEKADALTNDLGFLNVHYEATRSFDSSLLFDESVFLSEYHEKHAGIFVIPLKKRNRKTVKRTIGLITVIITHGSIWDYEEGFDCVIHNELIGEVHENYLPPDPVRNYLPVEQIRHKPFEKILEMAEHNKWNSVAMVPFLKGRYQEVVDACRAWQGNHPQWIHFFYLEKDDLKELKSILAEDSMSEQIEDAEEKYREFYKESPEFLDFFDLEIPDENKIRIALRLLEQKIIIPWHPDYRGHVTMLDDVDGSEINRSLMILEAWKFRPATREDLINLRDEI